jgi:hypothetical protein
MLLMDTLPSRDAGHASRHFGPFTSHRGRFERRIQYSCRSAGNPDVKPDLPLFKLSAVASGAQPSVLFQLAPWLQILRSTTEKHRVLLSLCFLFLFSEDLRTIQFQPRFTACGRSRERRAEQYRRTTRPLHQKPRAGHQTDLISLPGSLISCLTMPVDS